MAPTQKNRIREIKFAQMGSEGDDVQYLDTDRQTALHWSDASGPRLLLVSYGARGWSWSGGYLIREIDMSELKLMNPEGRYERILVHAKTQGAQTAIILSQPNPEFPAYLIRNYTQETLVVSQAHISREEGEVVPPMSQSPYTWLEPGAMKKEITLGVAGTKVKRPRTFSLDEIAT